MKPRSRVAISIALVIASVGLASTASAQRSEAQRRLGEARVELTSGSAARALEAIEQSIRSSTTAEDEAAARGFRLQSYVWLGLARDGAGDAARLGALLESQALTRASSRAIALRLASWHRACADLDVTTRAPHLAAEMRWLDAAAEASVTVDEHADILELRSYSRATAGDYAAARRDLAAAESSYRGRGDDLSLGRCYRRGAFIAYLEGDPRAAIALLDHHRPLIPRGANGSADLTESRTHELLRSLASLDADDLAAAERSFASYVACSAELLRGLPWTHVLRTHRISEPANAALLGALHRYYLRHPDDERRVVALATALVEGASARLLRVALGSRLSAEDGRVGRSRALPRGVVVLRYHEALDERTGKRELLLFALRDGDQRILSLGDATALDARLLNWFRDCLSSGGLALPASDYAARTRALAATLLGPALEWLTVSEPRSDRLVIITEGILARLPFESLVLGESPAAATYSDLDYLVRHASVVHLPSLSILDALHPPSAGQRALVVLDPELDETRPRLRFSAVERDALLACHPGAVVIAGAAATESTVVAAIERERADWIHLACHAEADGTLRNTALLRLATPESGATETADGLLMAGEIFTLPLTPGARVVLSACSTAAGDYVRGEGILGLWRAFLTAGASCVVSTIRDVDDRCVATFMARFHTAAASGLPLADANRAAALEWLAGAGRPRFPRGSTIRDPAHPFLWANTICVGDDGGPLPQRYSGTDLK